MLTNTMPTTNTDCPICAAPMARVANPFCEVQGQLFHPGATVEQYLCSDCKHGWLKHDVPLELLYSSNVALPTEYVGGDTRFQFVAANLDLGSVSGAVVEFGGGPGELAEQARQGTGKPRAMVVDFVNRVAAPTLDFVPLDFNSEAAKIPGILAETATKRNLFLLSHVVEHLYDPTVLLRELAGFSDSVIYIEVPDFGAVHDIKALQFSLNCLEHLHYFNARSLTTLLEKAGLKIIAFGTQAAPQMPAIRALCVPANGGHNAVLDYQGHFAEIVQRLREKILAAPPQQEVWVWGLSAFMAQALQELGEARGRVAGIFDTRYPQPDFLGIPVRREPEAGSAAGKLIVCGSTYSAVQKVIKAKAQAAWPDAEFYAVSL